MTKGNKVSRKERETYGITRLEKAIKLLDKDIDALATLFGEDVQVVDDLRTARREISLAVSNFKER